MDGMDKKDLTEQNEAVPVEEAEVAAVQEVSPEVILQYRGYEANMDEMTERVKEHYYAKGYKRGSINNLQIYAKPEDFTAYYVINDGVVGKVNLF